MPTEFADGGRCGRGFRADNGPSFRIAFFHEFSSDIGLSPSAYYSAIIYVKCVSFKLMRPRFPLGFEHARKDTTGISLAVLVVCSMSLKLWVRLYDPLMMGVAPEVKTRKAAYSQRS